MLKKGRINRYKSDLELRPCPKLVVDGVGGLYRKNVEVR